MKAQELSPCPEETGVVKSAIRTLEILEYFDEVQQPLNIVAVATALDYPQSSTAALLRSLTTMGYLHYNSRKLTYVPTDRVPFLGSWINPALFQEAGLRSVFRSLHRAASVACRVMVLRSTSSIRPNGVMPTLTMNLSCMAITLQQSSGLE
ncbi:MAG: helix-turn-helix domain-containing protein [Pseudomonadota bacterium]